MKSKGFKKAFVASDPDLVKFGVTAKVTDLLKENGIEYELYSDIKPNPTIENVLHGVDAYKASKADFMITIGGGSSMDTGNRHYYQQSGIRRCSFSGGCCTDEEADGIYDCGTYNRWYGCRVNDQLRNHGCREEA